MTGSGAPADVSVGRTREALGPSLAGFLVEAGYAPVSPPVLQPIEPFLELSGEDIRRRIFVTQDEGGAELCLRPEFTIPVCRLHCRDAAQSPRDYSYLGPVFRLARSEPSEFLQAGIESIGRTDTAAADAEVLGLALEGLARLGRRDSSVRIGDMGLTNALLNALEVPPAAKRRTLRALAAGRPLADLANGAAEEDPNAGLLAAIQGQDPAAAKAFVENVLSIAGISRVGGRSAGDIAARFLAKSAVQANGGAGLNERNLALIERYRAIEGNLDEVMTALRELVGEVGPSDSLEQALGLFEERTGFIAARGIDVGGIRFSGGFARNLDYYTGFIFEVASAHAVLVGGGRYDGLLTRLGAPEPQPAVGCAFWLDRIAGTGDRDV